MGEEINTMNNVNSKPELNLVWTAYFEGELVINQYDGDNENRFKEVQDRFDKLVGFELVHKFKPLRVYVHIRRGLIFINQEVTPIDEITKETKSNIRLIYRRRNKVEMSIRGEILSHDLKYLLGYQYNDKDGFNHQVILTIDQEGNIAIGDI
jgi:hypothetical protein